MNKYYQQGGEAYEQGALCIDNPYNPEYEGAYYMAWEIGWMEAYERDGYGNRSTDNG